MKRLPWYFRSRERAEAFVKGRAFARYTIRDISNPAHTQFRVMARVKPN
jgi:hypothetical protein